MISTSDKIIRRAFCRILEKDLEGYRKRSGQSAEIFEELGVRHGATRVDIAVINGIMHGYEIKSDKDNLQRLPEQRDEYNEVFDKVTLVVGKNHLYEAIQLVPDWWGVIVAKANSDNEITFHTIRKAEENNGQQSVSIARLLWKREAVKILEEKKGTKDFKYKKRDAIYEKLAQSFDVEVLKDHVKQILVSREDWRSV